MKYHAVILIALTTLAFGCASAERTERKEAGLTYGNVKKNLIKGKTTQAELTQLLGSPNLVTRNRAGDEVWTYTRQSFDSESGAFGGGIILVGGSKAFSSASSSSFDLIVTFDKAEVVQDYSVVTSHF